MRISCLLHSELPGDTFLPEWARAEGHEWSSTLMPSATELPRPTDADCLVVLGGPMSAWQLNRYPWLQAEKRLLERFIGSGVPVLGICLGAQLLAEVLGGRTYSGPHKEIGWFTVRTTSACQQSWLGEVLPPRFQTFLWHGDTFDLPSGATHVASSEAFENQGFVWEHTLALQFHLEARPQWVELLTRRDEHELVPARFIQSAEQIIGASEQLYAENNALIATLLRQWLRRIRRNDSGGTTP